MYHASLSEASNAVDGLKSDLSYWGGQCAFSDYGKQTATWWVNLTSVHSIHYVTIYYMTNNWPWGTYSFLRRTFLGFSLYISNTTDKSQGTLCYKDSNYTTITIPPVVNITCPVHGQYVIFYNERLTGVSYPRDYYPTAFNLLCEVEVYGCPIPGLYGCPIPCPDPNCRYCHPKTGICQACKPEYRGHRCELDQNRCYSEFSDDIQWNTTLAGTTKREQCPRNQKGVATRQCNVEGVWEPPNLINCTTEAFLNASSELDTILEEGITDPEKTRETIDNTLHLMNNLTSSSPELSAGDISSSIDILEKIVNVTNSSGSSIEKEVFFSVVDNVLSSNNSKSWNAVSEKTEKDASSLLKNIDRLSEVVIQNDNISVTQFTGSNFELTINKTKIDETGIRFPEVTSKNSTEGSDTFSTFFELGKQKRKTDKAMGYVAVIYKNIADIFPASSERPGDTEKSSQKKAFVNSPVLSLTTEANIGSLNPPLKLTFQNVQTKILSEMQTLCVSWNFSTNKWSEQGCILVKRDIKGTVCECDHLTNFAILMRPYSSDTEDEQSLKTISLVGVILSIVFIVLTFMIYLLTWRFIKSDQNIMMLNLCASLVLAYVVFISSVEQKDNEGVCVAITALLHYLFLVTFFNMFGMGLYYFMSITVTYYAMYVANNFKSKSRIHWFLLGSWGIPFVIVMIGLGSFWDEGYHLRFYCWLSTESGSLYMFIVPVCLIAVINILIIVSLVRVLCSTSAMANSSLKKKAASGLRPLGTLLPVLGVTWLFGILAVNEKADAFQYIFVIANSLQGFFIFVSHVLLNRKVMLALRKKYPVLNTLVSFVESSKEDSSSVSKTNSSTEPHSALSTSKKRTFLVGHFGKKLKRNKVQKSESFLTEKTMSTDCTLRDDTENSVEISENVPDTNKLQLIVEQDSPKKQFKFSLNINPSKKKYTVTGM
uniref:Adhesion G protein-coupled receptor L4-like n=1 Tax=Crassostrea virginica TaxID=6565 RepID=A0A8B8C4I6_CRAVI|nr:adhesion G protein-coupled receptor L4-like [Crassostrea virginica]